MAKESDLREPAHGEKSTVMRELLAKNPHSKNMELASMYLDKMRALKVKEDRDLAKIAQAFAQEKTIAKKKLENAAVSPAPAPPAPVAPTVKPSATKASSNGAEDTPAMTALQQLVGLLGKQGVKKLVDSL